MTVERMTFDVAFGQGALDSYTSSKLIRDAIMKVEGVVGCEDCTSHSLFDSVDATEVMGVQNERKKVFRDMVLGEPTKPAYRRRAEANDIE